MVLVEVCHAVVQKYRGLKLFSQGKSGAASCCSEGAVCQVIVPELYLLRFYCCHDQGDTQSDANHGFVMEKVHKIRYNMMLLLVWGTGFHASMICCWNLYKNVSYSCGSGSLCYRFYCSSSRCMSFWWGGDKLSPRAICLTFEFL